MGSWVEIANAIKLRIFQGPEDVRSMYIFLEFYKSRARVLRAMPQMLTDSLISGAAIPEAGEELWPLARGVSLFV